MNQRSVTEGLKEAKRYVELITKPEEEISEEERKRIIQETVDNFANHINKGFLEYRKSVTQAGDYAMTEWTGQGSILKDALGREFIDMLGGFGIYSLGIRHPRVIAAVKAQLDRSPQYTQEMLDTLRPHLA
jgi:putrescine aminotransferase